jgi:hypothetical protein
VLAPGEELERVVLDEPRPSRRSDAIHQYKANAPSASDKPYIIEAFSLLTAALKRFREKLKAERVM